MEKVKIKLSKSVEAHGETVFELNLRPPIGKDIRKNGFPYTMDDQGNLSFNTKAIAKYIEELAEIPPSSVDALTPSDFQKCFSEIMGFFGGAPQT